VKTKKIVKWLATDKLLPFHFLALHQATPL
jgi:hypothetical protein